MPWSCEGSAMKLAWPRSHGLLDVRSPYGWVKNEDYLPKSAPRHLLLHLPYTSPLCKRYRPQASLLWLRLPRAFCLNEVSLCLMHCTGEDVCAESWSIVGVICKNLMGGLHAHALREHVTGERVRQYYSTSLYQLDSFHWAEGPRTWMQRWRCGRGLFSWSLIMCVGDTGASARGTSHLDIPQHNVSI